MYTRTARTIINDANRSDPRVWKFTEQATTNNGASWSSLPATEFAYGGLNRGQYLSKVWNNYGAEWLFAYQWLPSPSGFESEGLVISQTQRVNSGPSLTTEYTYSGRCYAKTAPNPYYNACYNSVHDLYALNGSFGPNPVTIMVGHSQVIEQFKDAAGTLLAKTQHNFDTTNYKSVGRETETRQYSTNGSTVLKSQSTKHIVPSA